MGKILEKVRKFKKKKLVAACSLGNIDDNLFPWVMIRARASRRPEGPGISFDHVRRGGSWTSDRHVGQSVIGRQESI